MTTFGVVICPGCKRVKGVDLSNKTSRCVCGRRLDISELKILYKTEEAHDLSQAIGRISARLEGREEEFEEQLLSAGRRDEEDPYPEITALAVQVASQSERAVVVLQGLGERLGSFTIDDAADLFNRLGLGDPKPWMDKLLRENVLYEPKRGSYRLV